MQKLKCPYFVEYYDDYDDNNYYYIVMEKYEDDLDKLMQRSKSGLSDIEIKKILLRLNEAFRMMLSKNVDHPKAYHQIYLVLFLNRSYIGF